jgi:PII-like signaling protein
MAWRDWSKSIMKTVSVLMVRVYIMESSGLLHKIVNYLKKDVSVRGISVFRAISGFGETGNHTTALVDLSLDLPLTLEFFDHKEKIEVALEGLSKMVKPEHIVTWEAKANL